PDQRWRASQQSFGARQSLRVALVTDGLPERTPERLEASFSFVVVILAFDLDVDGGAEAVRKRAEDMLCHLRRVSADVGRFELAFELREGPARQIDEHLRFGLVHRQREAEAPDPASLTERLRQSGTQGDRAILNAVM